MSTYTRTHHGKTTFRKTLEVCPEKRPEAVTLSDVIKSLAEFDNCGVAEILGTALDQDQFNKA
jgi:hypothetical protein